MSWKIPKNKELRIAISSKSGCGNTTVSKLLAETLDITLINFTFRNLAEKLNIPLKDIITQAKTDFSFDKEVDTTQVRMAQKQSCVLASRLAIWMLSEADLKVYLTASSLIRAKRIQKREGGDLQSILDFTHMRDTEDTRRYNELYNIDNNDYSCADIIIETAQLSAESIVLKILEELQKRNLIEKR